MPGSPEPTAPPAVPTPAEAAAPAVSAPSPKSTAAPLQPAAGDGAAVKEAGAPADDHEEAEAAEEGAAEEGAAAGTAATAAAPAAPTVQAVSPSPPKLDGAPAALPEEGTVDRGEQAEERCELLNAANRLALLSILLPVLRAAPSIHLRRCRGRGRPRPRPRQRVRIERQLQSHPPEFGPPRTQQTTVFARAANSGGPGGPPGPLCLAIASESYNLSIEFAWDLMEVTCIWPSGDARAV